MFYYISFPEQGSMKHFVGLFSNFLLQMRLEKVMLMKQLSYDQNAAASNQVWTTGRLPRHSEACTVIAAYEYSVP